MNRTEFEARLAADGYGDVAVKQRPPRDSSPEHGHAYAVRALVLEGELTITIAGRAWRFGPGETFDVAAGCPHAETVGAEGVRFVYGTRG